MTPPSQHWLQAGTGRIQKWHLFLMLVFVVLPNAVHATDCLVSPGLPCTFTLTDPFNGANWPTQPIDFRYDGGFAMVRTAKMVNGSGTEVPFQWVSACWDPTAIYGCIEIQDSLPAGATQTYTLEVGPPSATAANPVVVTYNVPCYSGGANCIQISNGITGVQVPTVTSNSSASYRLAPIQGCMLPSGNWTCAIGGSGNPNVIYTSGTPGAIPASYSVAPLRTTITTATGYTTKFLDAGPLKTSLQLSYAFNRPDYYDNVGGEYINPVTCTAAGGSYPYGYVTFGGAPPVNSTMRVQNARCGLVTADYYTMTAVPGVTNAYTMAVVSGGVSTPVTISSGSAVAVFVINSTTGCSNGCQNSGNGRLNVTITLYANAKSLQITEDSDMLHAEYYPFYNEIIPDTARFRSARGTAISDPRCGYTTPLSVSSVGTVSVTGGTTATVTLASGSVSNGQMILLTGVGSGSTLQNGVYYTQTTSPGSATAPVIWPCSGMTITACGSGTTAPGSYTGGGFVKLAANTVLLAAPVYDSGFDFPWTYGDPSFVAADPYNDNFNGCAMTSGHLTGTPPLDINLPPSDAQAVRTWESYQVAGSSSSPVFGWYTGDTGLMEDTAYFRMPGPYIAASGFVSGWGRTTAIEDINWITNTGIPGPTIDNWGGQKSWGIFVDTNANLPTFPFSAHPPIQDDQNKYTGVNLSHLYAYHVENYNTPTNGWEWLYQTNSNSTNAGQEMNCLIARVQSNSNCSGLFPDDRTAPQVPGGSKAYYNLLYNSATDPVSHAILNMWQSEATSPSTAVGTAITASGCPSSATAIESLLANGDNHWDPYWGYYQGILGAEGCFEFWNAVLMDPHATTLQKAQMYAEAGLLGGLVWDNSWFGWDNQPNDGQGTANQATMYAQDRSSFVYQYGVNGANALLASKVSQASASAGGEVGKAVGCNGAVTAGTHYEQTYEGALIPSAQISALQGLTSFVNQCQFTQGYPNWLLAVTTPPDPRYGNLRKMVAMGDSTSEEGNLYAGILATDLYTTNAVTAGWMSWLWHQFGNSTFQYLDYSIPGLLLVDETIPQITPALISQQIAGDYAVQRAGMQGGGQETALWFINGGNPATQPIYYDLSDHRHYDDGNVTIFALGAPLAMDWGANLYNPDTPPRFMHNSITFDAEIPSNGCSAGSGCTWSSNAPSLGANGFELLTSPTVTAFQGFRASTQSTATFTYSSISDSGGDGTVWTRSVRTMAPDPSYPIFYVKDTFAGGSGGGKTLTWNLEATGAVMTPSGSKTPTTAFSNGCQDPAGANPSSNDTSGLAPYSLGNGLQSFTFAGFVWPQYAGTNIKWNLYERPTSGNAQWLIGNWGHGCGVGYEQAEFEAANSSASWYGNISNACHTGNNSGFCDWQHILRIHDTGPFETVITPTVASGAQPSVSYSGGVYTAAFGSNESLSWNDSYSTFTNGVAQILTTYNSSTQSGFGMTASGGPQEVANNGAGTITWTIDDVNPASRALTLPPGVWYPSVPVRQNAGVYTYYHGGGAAPSPAIVTFTQTPGTLRSVPLNYSAPPGATQVRVKFGSSTNYAAIASCNPLCSIVMQSPLGTWQEQHDFLDGNGNVITSSQVRSVVVQ